MAFKCHPELTSCERCSHSTTPGFRALNFGLSTSSSLPSRPPLTQSCQWSRRIHSPDYHDPKDYSSQSKFAFKMFQSHPRFSSTLSTGICTGHAMETRLPTWTWGKELLSKTSFLCWVYFWRVAFPSPLSSCSGISLSKPAPMTSTHCSAGGSLPCLMTS